MTSDVSLPPMVFTLWRVTVVLALVLFVPMSVYLLHSLWRAAASVRGYTREALVAARGIETNARALPALDGTIEVATGLLEAAEAVASKLGTVGAVLEARTRRRT